MRNLTSILLAASIPALIPLNAQAWDLNNVLGKLGSAKGNPSATSTDGKTKDTLGSFVGGLFSRDDLTVSDIVGNWKYVEPAISFQSENLLLKAGGVAATEKIRDKIEPYFRAAGLDKLEMTIGEDSTFTMSLKRGSLKGTISKNLPEDSEANFIFSFKAFGSLSMGKMETYITRSGDNMSLMFDITKLVQLLQKLSSLSGYNTAKDLSSLLDKYDGIHAGFKLSPVSEGKRK